jgi:hypothetical protein
MGGGLRSRKNARLLPSCGFPPFRRRNSPQQSPLGLRQRSAIIVGREQMSVGIHRHYNRGVTEPLLHDFRRQPKATFLLAIDAPRRIEVPERMQAGIAGRKYGSPVSSRTGLPSSPTTPSATPAAICAGAKPRLTMLPWFSTWPTPLANAKPNSPFGQSSFGHHDGAVRVP